MQTFFCETIFCISTNLKVYLIILPLLIYLQLMKKLILLTFTLFSVIAFSQNSNDLITQQKKIKQAIAYNDLNVAASSMYSMIALEGPQSTYKDSLAYLYFNNRNYVSCFLVTSDILKNKPDNTELLEMNAISLESMGAISKAVEVYENLITKKKSNFFEYKIAGLKNALKKYDEAYVAIKNAEQMPDDGKIKVSFQVNQNYKQDVDLKAAIPYLKGIIEMNLNKNAEAKQSFEKALQLFPDFAIAKSKLTVLDSKK